MTNIEEMRKYRIKNIKENITLKSDEYLVLCSDEILCLRNKNGRNAKRILGTKCISDTYENNLEHNGIDGFVCGCNSSMVLNPRSKEFYILKVHAKDITKFSYKVKFRGGVIVARGTLDELYPLLEDHGIPYRTYSDIYAPMVQYSLINSECPVLIPKDIKERSEQININRDLLEKPSPQMGASYNIQICYDYARQMTNEHSIQVGGISSVQTSSDYCAQFSDKCSNQITNEKSFQKSGDLSVQTGSNFCVQIVGDGGRQFSGIQSIQMGGSGCIQTVSNNSYQYAGDGSIQILYGEKFIKKNDDLEVESYVVSRNITKKEANQWYHVNNTDGWRKCDMGEKSHILDVIERYKLYEKFCYIQNTNKNIQEYCDDSAF